MNGRLLGIKKTTIIRLSFIVNFILLTLGCVYFFSQKTYEECFFVFCLFIGIHFIVRSMLFGFDSSCYIGNLLLFIGLFYFYCRGLDIYYIYPAFIVLAFSIASFLTYCFFRQPFNLFLSLSLLFAVFSTLFYIVNVISIYFFLAILIAVVLSWVCRYLTL